MYFPQYFCSKKVYRGFKKSANFNTDFSFDVFEFVFEFVPIFFSNYTLPCIIFPLDGCPISPCGFNEYCSNMNGNLSCKCHFGFKWSGSSCDFKGMKSYSS